ncbi:eukaryotic translation initiation factor 3 subunit J [Dendroctonus ponderosae]
MESWDDENFEPLPVIAAALKTNKWVGEDEEEDVKESWEDDDEDEKQEEKKVAEPKKSKKKSLADKIAEKEAKKREELEKRLAEDEDLSPEERLRMQKESDLKLALETTFGGSPPEEIDGLKLPSTTGEFEQFTETLTRQLTPLSRHGNDYVNFTEGLARNLCAAMSSNDIKKIKNTLDNLYLEKQKIEKGDKAKKNKGKGKARLKIEGSNQLLDDYAANTFDEFDDFM